MSSDKPEGAAAQDDATMKLPTGAKPGSTLHSYPGGWRPPTVEQMQQMLPQYQFIEMLGAGGMGAVYKAVQVSLDRLVAIKILPPGLVDDCGANFTERFRQEAKTMAKMSHPCIVNVYDFGQTDGGQFYFVMEFIEGTDVQKMIRANKKLKPDDALAITAHVCDALEYAHKRGVIHRDIKPANVLISAEGVVKIADFGLAKAVDSKSHELTLSNMAMGTPHFMAPEALSVDVKVDARADLYAVGVMLHNMLTGEIPTGRFELPSKTIGCDRRFDQIVDKAMQANRDMRYQHASEIRHDLDTILTTPVAAEGVDAIPVVPPQEMTRGQKMKAVTDSVIASAPKMQREAGKPGAEAKEQPKAAQKPVAPAASSPGFGKIMAIISVVVVAILGAVYFFSSRPEKPAAIPVAAVAAVTAARPERVSTHEAGAPPPERQVAKAAVSDAWKSMIPLIDVNRDAKSGAWKIENGALVCAKPHPWALCEIPVDYHGGNYDLRFRITRGEGQPIGIFLPFRKGARGGDVVFDYFNPNQPLFQDGKKRAGFVNVEAAGNTDAWHANLATRTQWMPRARTVAVLLQVRDTYCTISADGEEISRWKWTAGDLSRIRQGDGFDQPLFKPVSGRPVFGVGAFGCEVVFNSIEMREEAGDERHLRP